MSNLPYVTAYGNIAKALDAIKKAAVPEKVSGDFVKTILGIKGGSGDQITSFFKKIGFVDASGSPTKLYNQFRNPATAGDSVATALKNTYRPLFDRNEFVYELSDDDLRGLIVEETGAAHDSSVVKMTVNCFKALRSYATFDSAAQTVSAMSSDDTPKPAYHAPQLPPEYAGGGMKLNIGYNIHLNLPATDDIAVFNAIFKSLKENLLVGDE